MARTIKRSRSKKTKGSRKGEASLWSSTNLTVASGPTQVWQLGVDALEEGEELQFDPQAYNYLRGFSIGWPCLSFDVLRDQLGLVRSEFPHTLYDIAGTQGVVGRLLEIRRNQVMLGMPMDLRILEQPVGHVDGLRDGR